MFLRAVWLPDLDHGGFACDMLSCVESHTLYVKDIVLISDRIRV